MEPGNLQLNPLAAVQGHGPPRAGRGDTRSSAQLAATAKALRESCGVVLDAAAGSTRKNTATAAVRLEELPDDVRELLRPFDSDGSGTIDRWEALAGILTIQSRQRSLRRVALAAVVVAVVAVLGMLGAAAAAAELTKETHVTRAGGDADGAAVLTDAASGEPVQTAPLRAAARLPDCVRTLETLHACLSSAQTIELVAEDGIVRRYEASGFDLDPVSGDFAVYTTRGDVLTSGHEGEMTLTLAASNSTLRLTAAAHEPNADVTQEEALGRRLLSSRHLAGGRDSGDDGGGGGGSAGGSDDGDDGGGFWIWLIDVLISGDDDSSSSGGSSSGGGSSGGGSSGGGGASGGSPSSSAAAPCSNPADWHPDATLIIPDSTSRRGLTLSSGYSTKHVWHTTESTNYYPSTASFYGHSSWPHATISAEGIFQHIPITKGAYALRSSGCAVETNRGGAIQIEIVAKAKDSGSMSHALRENIAAWTAWVSVQLNTPLEAPAGFHASSSTSYGTSSESRLSSGDWRAVEGVVGHQHVPCNTHWDPGAPPVDAILATAEERVSGFTCGIGGTPPSPGSGCTGEAAGQCGSPGSCGGTLISGLCPGDASNVCCLPGSDSGCAAQGGTCKSTNAAGASGACAGSWASGLCPGSSAVRCCVPP